MVSHFLILFILLLVNAFFSIAEVALISANRTKLQALAQIKNRQAKTALYLMDKPELFLSTVQIGITFVSFLFGYVSLELAQPPILEWLKLYFEGVYLEELVSLVTLVLATYFSSLLAEIIPKRLGIVYADKICLAVSYPLYISFKIFYPLVWLLSKSSSSILNIFGIKKEKNKSYTEPEIKMILSESEKQGNIDEKEKEMIERVFSLGDRNITSIMLHRQHLEYLQTSLTVKQARTQILKTPHSQYPVCDGDLDNLKGIISVKDLFAAKDEKKKIEKIMNKPMVVPETISVYSVLEQMKVNNQKICFVVDEYGSVEGMLSLSHIVGAIVGGDIASEEKDKSTIRHIKNNRFLVDGSISFYDFLEYFDKESYHNLESEESDEYDTVAGFMIYQLERMPKEGDAITWKEFSFMVADMDDHRIDKVIVEIVESNLNQE